MYSDTAQRRITKCQARARTGRGRGKLRCVVLCGVVSPSGERGTNTHLGVGRLLRSESSAHQFRGAHRGSRAERMECASGVNAEGEDAKDGAEHDGSSRCRKRTKMFMAS